MSRLLLILLLFVAASCHAACEDDLVTKVVTRLGHFTEKSSNFPDADHMHCLAMPDDPDRSVIAYASQELDSSTSSDDSSSQAQCDQCTYDFTVAVVRSRDGKLLAKYHRDDAFPSDADALRYINIDGNAYTLAKGITAFGVIDQYEGSSSVDPSSKSELTLFVQRGNKLDIMVDGLIAEDGHGDNNGSGCQGTYTDTSRAVDEAATSSHGYADLIITEKVTDSSTDNCKEKSHSKSQKFYLHYDGSKYPLPQNLGGKTPSSTACGSDCFNIPVSPATGSKGWPGVWQGMLGKQAIVACFNDTHTGNYYYVKHHRAINLAHDHADGSWREYTFDSLDGFRDTNGFWTLPDIAGDETTHDAVWKNPYKNRRLPMHLVRVAAVDPKVPACASDTYLRPLLAEPKEPVEGRAAVLKVGTHRYHDLLLMSGDNSFATSFRLLDATPVATAINEQLAQFAPSTWSDANATLTELRQDMGSKGQWGFTAREVERSYANKRWLSFELRRVRFDAYSVSDPSGSGYHIAGHHTWDLQLGAEVNPLQWFSSTTIGLGQTALLPQPLRDKVMTLLTALNSDSATCKNVLRNLPVSAWPDDGHVLGSVPGITFNFQTEGTECPNPRLQTFMPFVDLKPYLSKSGKAIWASLEAQSPIDNASPN